MVHADIKVFVSILPPGRVSVDSRKIRFTTANTESTKGARRKIYHDFKSEI